MPVDNLVSKPDKPEKYTERFVVEEDKSAFNESQLKIEYKIKPISVKRVIH